MWELDNKKGWAPKNVCFWTVVLEKILESPLDSKEIKPVNPKGSHQWIFIGRTDAEAEALILWPPNEKSRLTGKAADAGKDWRQEEKGMIEDEMVGWHHWLDGHEFEQAPGDGEGQGSLTCCSPWGQKESDTTEELNDDNEEEVHPWQWRSQTHLSKTHLIMLLPWLQNSVAHHQSLSRAHGSGPSQQGLHLLSSTPSFCTCASCEQWPQIVLPLREALWVCGHSFSDLLCLYCLSLAPGGCHTLIPSGDSVVRATNPLFSSRVQHFSGCVRIVFLFMAPTRLWVRSFTAGNLFCSSLHSAQYLTHSSCLLGICWISFLKTNRSFNYSLKLNVKINLLNLNAYTSSPHSKNHLTGYRNVTTPVITWTVFSTPYWSLNSQYLKMGPELQIGSLQRQSGGRGASPIYLISL